MTWELIDHNPHTGLKKYAAADPDNPDGGLIRYEQPGDAVAAILDRNKESQTDPFDRRSDMWHAAHIPTGVMYEWIVKHGVNFWNPAHKDGVRRLLNDPEYRYLRVHNFIM